jgi:membrane protein implicated in regulation of membrane protease activity
MLWQESWVWLAAALVLGVAEVILPGFILLGFAIGAGSLPILMLTFAILSVIAWLALRRLLGVRKGQLKTFEHDIND